MWLVLRSVTTVVLFTISQLGEPSKLIGVAGKRTETTKPRKLLRHLITVATLFGFSSLLSDIPLSCPYFGMVL